MSETTETFVLSKRGQFEKLFGPIETPQQVARYNEFVTRQTGRTTVMVEAIAKCVLDHKKVALVVHSSDWGREIVKLVSNYLHANYLSDSLIDLYSLPEVSRRILIVPHDGPNWKDKLTGYSNIHVFVDNAVTDIVACDFVDDINKFVERVER